MVSEFIGSARTCDDLTILVSAFNILYPNNDTSEVGNKINRQCFVISILVPKGCQVVVQPLAIVIWYNSSLALSCFDGKTFNQEL